MTVLEVYVHAYLVTALGIATVMWAVLVSNARTYLKMDARVLYSDMWWTIKQSAVWPVFIVRKCREVTELRRTR